MKVLIVNTSEQTGGAAVAANRLKVALNNNGIEANMLVRDRLSDDETVFTIKNNWCTRWNRLWERWCVFWHLHFSKRNLFAIDIANAGTDITELQVFKDADVIHLAWINQGMLSLKSIEKILKSGKPLVWTMHDIWPATAVCHITLDCRKFESQCKQCRLLPSGIGRDLAKQTWKRKEAIEGRTHIIYIRGVGEQTKRKERTDPQVSSLYSCLRANVRITVYSARSVKRLKSVTVSPFSTSLRN